MGFETAAGTAKCKQVAQLASWVASAYLWMGNVKKTEESIKKAEALTKKVFGATSWEAYRLMKDRVRLCQVAADGKDAQSVEARKCYSKAERIDTQAVILLEKLKDKADDVLV